MNTPAYVLERRLALVTASPRAAQALADGRAARARHLRDLVAARVAGLAIEQCPLHVGIGVLACRACRGTGRVAIETITIDRAAA